LPAIRTEPFFTLYLQSAFAKNAKLPATKDLLPMKLRDRLEAQNYEQRLQEIRKERKAETFGAREELTMPAFQN